MKVWIEKVAVRLLRGFLRLVVNLVYRLDVHGAELLPRRGGALVVCNHLSYADPFLLGAASPRPLRYLMHSGYYRRPVMGTFARLMGAIPIAAEDAREVKEESLRRAVELARGGQLVCIFAEGEISRSGHLLSFARGLERIAGEARVPIVPVGLDGVWGSVFSFSEGHVLRKLPRRIPYPVRVEIGAPLGPDTPAWRVRDAVAERIAEARSRFAGPRDTLTDRFLRSARRNARRVAVVDTTGRRLTYRDLLRAALALRGVLDRRFPGEERLGIYLPPGAGAVIANLATALSGRVSVNLNYSLGRESLRDPIARAGLAHVITSPRFLKALGDGSPARPEATVQIEDLAAAVTRGDKLRAGLLSLLPAGLLASLANPVRDPARPATILFSSGSTGRPKGVVLSHGNVLSNLLAFGQVLDLDERECLLGVLPFFHSFGFTACLWAPLLLGARAAYHARPLDAARIGELAQAEAATICLATPTFYQSWMRRMRPEQLRAIRLALVGAEHLRPALADAWRERFGFELYEGYGCTELSPVVAVNLPDLVLPGSRAELNQPGSVGRPLPGVAVRIVDPDTGEPRPPEEPGAVLVKGPNVMLGYLDEPARTAEVLKGGWYDTGDLGRLDRRGFLVLTDRRSRFSKIGGEMVPHGRVEDVLADCARQLALAAAGDQGDQGDQSDEESVPDVAVSALPDERKGERLVVLHTALPFPLESLVERVRESELPALFQPRADQFVEVDAIPRLGSGKTDLVALRALAERKSACRKPASPV